MDEPAQVQLPHERAQVPFTLARRDRRAYRLGELSKGQSAANLRLLVQERNGGRVPLARYQTAGVQGSLAGEWVTVIGGDEEEAEDDDFGGEMD